MSGYNKLHPQYVNDDRGNPVSVMLPIGEYEGLLEDLEDLAAMAERRDEATLSHDEVVARLKRDGVLSD